MELYVFDLARNVAYLMSAELFAGTGCRPWEIQKFIYARKWLEYVAFVVSAKFSDFQWATSRSSFANLSAGASAEEITKS